MKKLLLIFFISGVVISQVKYETNFTGFNSVVDAAYPPASSYQWSKYYHNGISAEIYNTGADSIYFKGYRALDIGFVANLRGSIRWYRQGADTLQMTLNPQIYSEFLFNMGYPYIGSLNSSYGYIFKNTTEIDSFNYKIQRAYVVEVMDKMTGNDSIRIVKYHSGGSTTNLGIGLDSKSTTLAKIDLGYSFVHRYYPEEAGVLASMYCLRGEVIGDTIRGKIWKRTDSEPSSWTISVIDTDFRDSLSHPCEITQSGWVNYVDSLSCSIPPPPTVYSLTLTNPSSGKIIRGNRVNDLYIQWTKQNVDTVYVYLNNKLWTRTTSLFTVVPKDTLRNYTDTMSIVLMGKSRITSTATAVIPPTFQTPQTNTTITGTGTIADPYVLYSAQQYLDLVDTLSSMYKHLSLANNLDFKNITITDRDILNIHQRGWFGFVEGNGFTIKNFNIIRGQADSCFTEIAMAIFRGVGSFHNINIDSCNIIIDQPIKKIYGYDYKTHKNIYMNDAWDNGRQYNFAFNTMSETAFGLSIDRPGYTYNPAPHVSNVSITNSTIYVDLTNLGTDWNYTNVAALTSTARKFADPQFVLDSIWVDNVDMTCKLGLIKKGFLITGVTTWAKKITNSYYNGNITYSAIPDTNETQIIPYAYALGFGSGNYIENCYTRGTILFEGIPNYLVTASIFNNVLSSPNMASIYIDTTRNRIFTGFNYIPADSISKYFTTIHSVSYLRTMPIRYCYSDMYISGVKPFGLYNYWNLSTDNISADSLFHEYLTGGLENNIEGSLDYWSQKIYSGLWVEGSLDSYYNTTLGNDLTLSSVYAQSYIDNESVFGRTETQLKNKSTFTNWDFYGDTGWRISPSKNDGFPNLEIDSTYTFTYIITAADSSTIILPPIYDDALIRIVSTLPTKLNFNNYAASYSICMDVESSGCDSVKFFYSFKDSLHWVYFGKDSLKNDLYKVMDTTTICLQIPNSNNFGDLYFKIEGIIDTARYNLQLTELGKIQLIRGSLPCFFWGYDGEKFIWNRDISCAWNPSYHDRNQGWLKVNVGLTAPVITFIDTTFTPDANIDTELEFANQVPVDPNELKDRTSSITGLSYFGTSPVFIKNRGYYFKKIHADTGAIMMQDYRNLLEYEVYRIDKSINTYSMSGSGYSVSSMILVPTEDLEGIVLCNFYPLKSGWFGAIWTGTARYNAFPFLNNAPPLGIVFKGFDSPSGSVPYAILKLSGGVQYISTLFKGILPKAIISVIPPEGK